MCIKAVENYPHTLEFLTELYKAQNMCDKTVDTYPSAMEFVQECQKPEKIGGKAVNKCLFIFDCISDQYKTQEMFENIVSNGPSLIVYCPVKYITQVLKLILDCLVTSKTSKKLFTTLYADENGV